MQIFQKGERAWLTSGYEVADSLTPMSDQPHEPTDDVAHRFAAAAGTVALSVVATAAPVFLHFLSPLAALPAALVLGLFVANYTPAQAPLVVVFAALFQNTFISLSAPFIADKDEFDFIRGYSFVLTAGIWLFAFGRFALRPAALPAAIVRPMVISTGALAVVAIYFALGFAVTGMSALVYLRNIALPLFVFQLCLVFSAGQHVRATAALVAFAVLVLAAGYAEFLARDAWLAVTNGEAYWRLSYADVIAQGGWDREARETGIVVSDFLDLSRVTFLNTALLADLQLTVTRLFGPNMHAISFGYALAFLAIFLGASGRWLLALLTLPLLLVVGAKGALVLVAVVPAALVGSRLFGVRAAFLGFLVFAAAYSAFVIISGTRIGDYHILGLFGGLHGFMEAPAGRGLGTGGNLALDFGTIDWSRFQSLGRTEGAMESAVGVILYQMGVGGLVPLAAYGWIGAAALRLYGRTGAAMHGAAAYGAFIILVNGLFQEEALFSPLAIGLAMALAGLVLGAAARADASSAALLSGGANGPQRRRRLRMASQG